MTEHGAIAALRESRRGECVPDLRPASMRAAEICGRPRLSETEQRQRAAAGMMRLLVAIADGRVN